MSDRKIVVTSIQDALLVSEHNYALLVHYRLKSELLEREKDVEIKKLKEERDSERGLRIRREWERDEANAKYKNLERDCANQD